MNVVVKLAETKWSWRVEMQKLSFAQAYGGLGFQGTMEGLNARFAASDFGLRVLGVQWKFCSSSCVDSWQKHL